MYKFILILIATVLPVTALFAADKDTAARKSDVRVERIKSENTFEDLLRKMWSRLRAITPKMAAETGSRRTQVAGVRGAESTGTLLKPYWKGDRTADEKYVKELNAFHQAQMLANNGKYKDAAIAFNGFIKTFPKSDLCPNAQFGLGLAYGATGEKKKSASTLKRFLTTYPQHPLGKDAREMLASIK